MHSKSATHKPNSVSIYTNHNTMHSLIVEKFDTFFQEYSCNTLVGKWSLFSAENPTGKTPICQGTLFHCHDTLPCLPTKCNTY